MESHKNLASLYRERQEVRKKLSKLDTEIYSIEKDLDEETIVKAMSEVFVDDREFTQWFIRRKEVIERKTKKENIKKKLENNITLDKKDGFKNSTYIYGLYDNETMVYVGITNKIEYRLKQHRKSEKVFDSYKILNIFEDRFYALREENNLIKEHNPKYNKQRF